MHGYKPIWEWMWSEFCTFLTESKVAKFSKQLDTCLANTEVSNLMRNKISRENRIVFCLSSALLIILCPSWVGYHLWKAFPCLVCINHASFLHLQNKDFTLHCHLHLIFLSPPSTLHNFQCNRLNLHHFWRPSTYHCALCRWKHKTNWQSAWMSNWYSWNISCTCQFPVSVLSIWFTYLYAFGPGNMSFLNKIP
jgi:hypothetical protein